MASREEQEAQQAGPSMGQQRVLPALEALAASQGVLEAQQADPSTGQQQVRPA